jgi:hypothetical protein
MTTGALIRMRRGEGEIVIMFLSSINRWVSPRELLLIKKCIPLLGLS